MVIIGISLKNLSTMFVILFTKLRARQGSRKIRGGGKSSFFRYHFQAELTSVLLLKQVAHSSFVSSVRYFEMYAIIVTKEVSGERVIMFKCEVWPKYTLFWK